MVLESKLMHVRIENLLLLHKEVTLKKVRKYMAKQYSADYIEPVSIMYCAHEAKFKLQDGHHRVVAAYLLKQDSIFSKVKSCLGSGCIGFQLECERPYNIRHHILIK